MVLDLDLASYGTRSRTCRKGTRADPAVSACQIPASSRTRRSDPERCRSQSQAPRPLDYPGLCRTVNKQLQICRHAIIVYFIGQRSARLQGTRYHANNGPLTGMPITAAGINVIQKWPGAGTPKRSDRKKGRPFQHSAQWLSPPISVLYQDLYILT